MGEGAAKRVLVVDDDRSIREYLRFLLEDAGFEVKEAGNGVEALKCFEDSGFDVVVTDISMPEKDGIDTIIEIRKLDDTVKIMAMSGVAKSDRLLEIAKLYRANRIIKKPFQSDEFLTALEEVLSA